jgi:hypothetical protein
LPFVLRASEPPKRTRSALGKDEYGFPLPVRSREFQVLLTGSFKYISSGKISTTGARVSTFGADAAYGNGCPGSFGDELSRLIGNRNFGDGGALAAFQYPALGGEFIGHCRTGNEMDVELGSVAGQCQ